MVRTMCAQARRNRRARNAVLRVVVERAAQVEARDAVPRLRRSRDAVPALQAIWQRICAGEQTPGEGLRLARAVERQRRALAKRERRPPVHKSHRGDGGENQPKSLSRL
jgi:hypothetical protein